MADKHQKDPFTLFDLTKEIKAIILDIVDAEIAGDKDEVKALMAELDEFYDARESKHEGYVKVIKNSLAGAENHQSVSDEFGKRATALKNLAKRLKETLLDDMEQHGEEAVPAGIFKIARQQNSVPTVNVLIPDEDLPAEYQNVTVEADKTALRRAIKNGTEIDGVDMEYGEHVRIRAK